MITAQVQDNSLAKRLKAETNETHEKLDNSIMQAQFFSHLEGYGRFASMQAAFHRDIAPLYEHEDLRAIFPSLQRGSRLPAILNDLKDMGLEAPSDAPLGIFADGDNLDMPTALGWLYVAEGSNMGAALLRKMAAKMGLSDDHGARHLAPAAEGPAAQWRSFTAALDGLPLSEAEQARAVAGANAAFERVQQLVDARRG